ncbi:hypothetical protein DXG03_002498 [Asterophora parasitica]|uniref:Origin recognition complex subunit 2 n=1 Tax=Asterophora parasitica TaxID=117018 RepID=A0A9P7KB64_9AGAR|nr:hypothetical protein DXG03_002498 [Asterophora parasitica]
MIKLPPAFTIPPTMRHLGDADETAPSDGEEIEEDIMDEESDFEEPVAATGKRGKLGIEQDDNRNLIVETAFDAYFTHASTRSRTSANVFSSLVPPLTADEYAEAIASASNGPSLKPVQSSLLSESSRELLFSRFMRELAEGFNLLMYGFGSKRRVLNQFATDYCSKRGHVVVVNGFQPEFSLKDLMGSIEQVPGILGLELTSTTPEVQSKRIYDFFASSDHPRRRHLYLIFHNIDAAPLRASKAKSCLALLALNPRIHIVASVDHIHAPLLFSTSEATTRKPYPSAPPPSVPPRGFAWLWHDLTTLVPYDAELAYIDRTSVPTAHGGGPRKKVDAAAQTAATMMTETAALHILASVTQKAKKLFALIGSTQLAGIEEAAAGADGEEGEKAVVAAERDLQRFGIGYDILFTTARDNFIATNDTALRSLLGEFRDHGLVLAAQGTAGTGEVLWIPLRKERLASVLVSLNVE